MNSKLQQRLVQLEYKYSGKKLSESEYLQAKWDIMVDARENLEILNPVVKVKWEKIIKDQLGNVYVIIPPGPFISGRDDDYAELPAPIYMAKFPVTVSHFMKFLEDTGWDYPAEDLERLHLVSPEPNCPVSHVSWLDAKEYCRWMRKQTGIYYSLPSELEWEIAARGIDGRFFPWGYDDPDEKLACFQGAARHENTKPNNSFPGNASPFGCMDMVGNLWEWCLDDVDDPREPHILRGGSWCNGVEYANCLAQTISHPPEKRVDYGGFRMICVPDVIFEIYRTALEGGEADAYSPQRRIKQPLNTVSTTSAPTPLAGDTATSPKKSLKKLAPAPPAASPPPPPAATTERRAEQPAPSTAGKGGIGKRDLESMGVKFRRKSDKPTGTSTTERESRDKMAQDISEESERILKSRMASKRESPPTDQKKPGPSESYEAKAPAEKSEVTQPRAVSSHDDIPIDNTLMTADKALLAVWCALLAAVTIQFVIRIASL